MNTMPMPQRVQDALNFFYRDEAPSDEESWLKVIRAELHRLTSELKSSGAEIDELVRALTMCTDRAKLAESRLEAANALLGECHCYFEARGVDSRMIGEPLSLNEKIQSHLQGAGDE